MAKFYLRFKGVLTLLFMLAFSLAAVAQGQTVTGTVTDADDGSGIPGVNIVEKGTSNGTISDIDGNYSISVSDGATLVFSYVGYLSQEIVVGNQSTISVSLQADVTQLSEVVVIGYGAVKKSDLTGAVSSIGEEDFNKGVFTSPDQMLQGKAAGVQVFNNDGTPGGGSTVRIRGNSSVRTGNQPLYVVDGVPLDGRSVKPDPGEIGGSGSGGGDAGTSNPLNFLNPSDIASMEILKDASAAAIYGSRGANGVILITTKRGKSGAPKVDFGASFGVASMMRQIEVLDAAQYRQALSDYGLSGGDFGGESDAMDEITRSGITQNYTMSISGGTEKGSYRISAGYYNQEGIIEDSGLEKFTASVNGGYNFLDNDRLRIDFNLITAQNIEDIAPVQNNAGFTGDIIGQALQWNPTRPTRLPDGSFDIESEGGIINPVGYLAAHRDEARTTSLLASIAPSFKITDNLTYKFQTSLKKEVGVRETSIDGFINVQTVQGRGWSNYGTGELTTQQYTHTLSYDAPISSNINLNAVIGYEYQVFDFQSRNFGAKDFLQIDDINYTNILNNSSQDTRTIETETDPTAKLQSYFARAIVNVNDKYIFTGTVRADGSSKFGSNNQYGVFPSFAAKWNLTNEEFFNLGLFDNLAVRASWGQTGNQEFPAGSAQERYELTDNTAISGLENVANPDLQWETSTTINIGLDFALLNAKLTGSIEWFDKSTEDLLFNFQAIQPAPASRFWANLDGTLKNTGVEIALDWLAMDNSDMQLNFGGNISFLSNELQDYTGPEVLTGELNGQGISNTSVQRIMNNQPVNVFFTRDWQGLDENGFDVLRDGGANFIVGDPNPDVLYGFFASYTYKKLDVVVNFAGAAGHEIYNNTANTVIPIGNLGSRNISEELLGLGEDRANSIKASDRYLEKGNYFKMTNFSIGYSVGDVGSAIKNLRIALTGQNLFVITDFTGFDPEVNTDKARDEVPSFGIEFTPYPTPRTFLLNVNFSL